MITEGREKNGAFFKITVLGSFAFAERVQRYWREGSVNEL